MASVKRNNCNQVFKSSFQRLHSNNLTHLCSGVK
jgi:hypothetical protein